MENVKEEKIDIKKKVDFNFIDINNKKNKLKYEVDFLDCNIYDLNWLIEALIERENKKLKEKNEELILHIKEYEKIKNIDVEYKYPLISYYNTRNFLCYMDKLNLNKDKIIFLEPYETNGKNHLYKIKLNDKLKTVKDLINEIFKETDISKENKLELYLNETKLNFNRELSDYGIKDKSIIKYKKSPKIIGGSSGSTNLDISFLDPNENLENDNKKIFNFVKTAPDYRKVKYGLNVEGICKNEKCIAYNKKVIINLKYGNFNLRYDIDKIYCPMCKNLVEYNSIGFSSCKYRFDGIKREKEGKDCNYSNLSKDDYYYVGKRFELFKENVEKISWLSLKLDVQRNDQL